MYSLKNLPPCSSRPASPSTRRWLIALAAMLATGILLMRIAGRYSENKYFWAAALGVPVLLWGTIAACRLLVWMLINIRANAYDRQRERWILRETRRARRALQVLNVTFISGYPQEAQADVVDAMLHQQNILISRSDDSGAEGVRMSLIDYSPRNDVKAALSALFLALIVPLRMKPLAPDIPLVVFFDNTSSVPDDEITQIWQDVWEDEEMTQPLEFADGTGPELIDRWLDERVRDNALLLIVGLQIAPPVPDNRAEVAVALLLGNRLTQDSLPALALLHRPDPVRGEEYEASMKMAAYNVPVQGSVIKHLWLAGMTPTQYTGVAAHQEKHPLQAVTDETVMRLDGMMGHAGAAAPWLALAAAAQAAQQTQLPQMIISGDATQDVLWSTIITPTASGQEIDA
ncbi:hypothetical protein [Pluralibacter gergoviae]|uniref:hypothetical protein n=1 Tax=Pluralibacter gergoviae TaxID=61647 RepID=UPI000B13B785|nr:hypothetical protein [Pluralibacter gergoviae]